MMEAVEDAGAQGAGGSGEANAARTTRRCTPYRSASPRTEMPSLRESRRIASNISTLDLTIGPSQLVADIPATTLPVGPTQTVTTTTACRKVGPDQAVTNHEQPDQVGPDQTDKVGPDQTVRANRT